MHCRNDDGSNTSDPARFQAAYDAIRAASDLIVQFTTGGAVGMTPEERAAPLAVRPEMATLTCGTVNFGDEVFENSFPIMRGILAAMERYEVKPELEIFDAGHLVNAKRLVREGLLEFPQHVDFVLGVAAIATAMGGHVRVGLEDNIYYAKGRLAANDELVARVARIAAELGRPIASPDQARSTLGLPGGPRRPATPA